MKECQVCLRTVPVWVEVTGPPGADGGLEAPLSACPSCWAHVSGLVAEDLEEGTLVQTTWRSTESADFRPLEDAC